jgi:hypothetical protein
LEEKWVGEVNELGKREGNQIQSDLMLDAADSLGKAEID